MSKLYLPIGLIGSGKSTWAREFIQANPYTKIVAGDDIRYMLAGGKEYNYSKSLEPIILNILYDITRTLLRQDYDVILDECYCSLNREMRLRIAEEFNYDDVELTAVVFPTKDMKDHIDDKILKGLRGKTVNYWKRVFCEMKEIYEPLHPTEHYFNQVINI
ncbi:AAA family ATPase [Candidatus Pacearchaeota archaeon]|nr:AAA family ATPase [Candidatus Pacearchaeota archaeon]